MHNGQSNSVTESLGAASAALMPKSRVAFAEADRLRKLKGDDQVATFAVSAGLKKLAAKDLPGAIASFREAVRLAPEQAQAQYQLGLALQKAGATVEARRHLAVTAIAGNQSRRGFNW